MYTMTFIKTMHLNTIIFTESKILLFNFVSIVHYFLISIHFAQSRIFANFCYMTCYCNAQRLMWCNLYYVVFETIKG